LKRVNIFEFVLEVVKAKFLLEDLSLNFTSYSIISLKNNSQVTVFILVWLWIIKMPPVVT